MVSRVFRLLRLLVIAALVASIPRVPGAAVDAPLDLRYALYWAGLHIGDLRLVHEVGPATYSSKLRFRTVGLAEWLAGYRSEARIDGVRNGADVLRPKRYRYRQSSKQVSRTANVVFDPETGAALEAASTKRGDSQRIEVPEALWSDVVDPLTAFFELRSELVGRDPAEHSRPTVRVFDGRRRFDVHADVTGRSQTDVNGRDVPVLQVDVTIQPIAGFDEGDRETWTVRALLSDDDRLVPIEIRTVDETFTGVIRLRDGYAADAA